MGFVSRTGSIRLAAWAVLAASLLAGAWTPPEAGQAGPTYLVRVAADARQRDWLSSEGYDIAGHDLPRDRVELLTGRDGLERLARQGLAFEILESWDEPRGLEGAGTDAPLPDTKYTDPSEMAAFLAQVVLDHPDITRLETIGTTHDSMAIQALMISDNAAVDEDELAVLFSGAHHAREVMTPEVVKDLIDYLTDNYPGDPDVAAAVDGYQIWCVPIVNPDGVQRVFDIDFNWRKNTRDNDTNGTIDIYDGVDLNRNYEWGFGNQCLGSSGNSWEQTYRGPSEGSEPEVQAMIALGRRITPVFDVEYHSYGEDVFFATSCDPDAFAPKLSTIAGPDTSISRVIAEAYAAAITQADGGLGFTSAPFGSRVDGVGRDHQYHENGAIAFVTEVNSSIEGGFRPDFDTWRDVTVQGQRTGWLWLLDRLDGPAVGGWVTDAVSGLPVRADVSLDELTLPDGKRLTSRADTGRFHVLVVPGSYTLRVAAPGYADAMVNVVVGASFSPVQVQLTPTGSSRVLFDDFEDPADAAAWTLGDPGDTATEGHWVWGEPEGTHTGSVQSANLEFGNARFDRTPGEGRKAFVTGNDVAAGFDADDVDGGVTTLISPSFDLSAWYGVELSWQRWFRNDVADPGDLLEAEVSDDGGVGWTGLETLTAPTATPDASPAWVATSVTLDDFVAPGADIRLRFRASDTGSPHTVEAAIDDLEIRGYSRVAQGRVWGVVLGGAASTVLDWNAVAGPAGIVYDVMRGDLSALSGGPGGVDLGALTCIENDSLDPSTSGSADNAVPASGQAFFYVVRFNLGFSTGDLGEGSEGGLRAGTGGCAP